MLCRVVRVLVRVIWFVGTRRKALVLESASQNKPVEGAPAQAARSEVPLDLACSLSPDLANEKITQQYTPDERL
jgi:hypothetical protein